MKVISAEHSDGPLKCKWCGKELAPDMEIEYSGLECEYFCSSDCATNYYFEFMQSMVIYLDESEDLEVVDGKVFQKRSEWK